MESWSFAEKYESTNDTKWNKEVLTHKCLHRTQNQKLLISSNAQGNLESLNKVPVATSNYASSRSELDAKFFDKH